MNTEQCAVISGTNMLVTNLLSPVNYVEGTPQMVDWMEIWIIWRPNQQLKLIVEHLKHSWMASALSQWAYPPERDNGHQEILFPWKVEHGLQLCFDPLGWQDQTFSTKILPQNITLPHPACFHPIMVAGVTLLPGCLKALTSNDLVTMWCGKHMDRYWHVSCWFKGPTYISSWIWFVICFNLTGEVSSVENREEATVMSLQKVAPTRRKCGCCWRKNQLLLFWAAGTWTTDQHLTPQTASFRQLPLLKSVVLKWKCHQDAEQKLFLFTVFTLNYKLDINHL